MRLPIRARLTAWYALLLAAILVALGAFVVLRLEADLRGTVDRELEDNAVPIAAGYAGEGAEDFRDVGRQVLPRSGAFAQILDPEGRVVHAYGSAAGREPVISGRAQRDALKGRHTLLTVTAGPDRQQFRVIARPVRRLGRRRVLVVAESLRDVEAAVERVLVLLLLAGPAALIATGMGGWWLARKALEPVERMTSQAEQIGIDQLHERVPVPRAADEVGHLAVTLNAMLDRLERGVNEKHRLIADASHELRTPLAVMRVELDVSLRGDDLPPEARTVLESAREEVDRMSRTVNNLLTLAQVDEGRLALLPAAVDLRDAVGTAVRPLEPLAAAKQVELEVTGEACPARADPQRVHQALTNFIENAIKFSPPGSRVTVTAWRGEDEVGVTVADDGPGIPATAVDHVFDRFYRVDKARTRGVGGSGLGLAICQEIASAHGGRVWVDSEEGKGSAFSLALPVARARSPLSRTPA